MQKKGFTLIEIMIVLLVFSIGVLAVLKLILYNMDTMSDLDAKTTATLLAKEEVELAYNTRDSNRLASLPRDCIINKQYNENIQTPICKNSFLDNNWLRTIEIKNGSIEWNKKEEDTLPKLFLTEQGWYTYTQNNNPSIFSRYISFIPVKDQENIIKTWYLLKIESHVIYQRGSKTGEVILEGFIWNY